MGARTDCAGRVIEPARPTRGYCTRKLPVRSVDRQCATGCEAAVSGADGAGRTSFRHHDRVVIPLTYREPTTRRPQWAVRGVGRGRFMSETTNA
jgi:hypothetical protein